VYLYSDDSCYHSPVQNSSIGLQNVVTSADCCPIDVTYRVVLVSKWRLLCPPYSAPDRECITKVCKDSSSVIKTQSKQMCFELALKTHTSCQLHELLLVDCSIQLGRPQRRLCRQISFLSVEQCSRCWTPSRSADRIVYITNAAICTRRGL